MKLLVFGSREWVDRDRVWRSLFIVNPSVVIEGSAKRGADRFARQWAQFYRRALESYPVDHRLDGPWLAAGHKRNARMHRDGKPDKALGFIVGPRGSPRTRGSESMLQICLRHETPVAVRRDDGWEVV